MLDPQTSLMHPCFFGINLQQGAQLVAGINIVASVLLMLIITVFLFMYESDIVAVAEATGADEGGMAGMVFVIWMIFLIAFIIQVGIHVLLLKGANEKSAKKIKIYLISSVVMMVLGLIGSMTHTLSFAMALITLLSYLPLGYELWMVLCFYKEIINEPQGQSAEFEP